MISLKYSLLKEDYVSFYTYVVWDAPENRKKRIIYYVKQALPIVLFLAAFYYTGIFERNSNFILLILGFIFLTSILSLFGVRSNAVRAGEKIANDPSNSSFFSESTLTVSESGIQIKDELKEAIYHWAAFIKKQESRNHYFLFTSSLQGLILPKRIFSKEEKLLFEKLLTQHLSFDAELGHLVKS